MKLNLLPTYVTKGKASKTAAIIALAMFLVAVGASVGMSLASAKVRDQNKLAEAEMRKRAQATVDTAAQADTIIASSDQIIKNTALARAMISHNAKYPAFYNRFIRFIPPFFRVTSIAATPISATSSQVQMQGVLKTYQQYSDLMVALMRYPKATSIQRSGFQSVDTTVPPLSMDDQVGTAIRPGQAPVPSDPYRRLQYYMSQPNPQGFDSTGGFGTSGNGIRTAAANYSLISVTMVVDDGLQTPDPRVTLSSSGGGAAAASTGFPGMGGGMGGPPTGFGGPPTGMMGAPPAGAPPMDRTSGRGGSGDIE